MNFVRTTVIWIYWFALWLASIAAASFIAYQSSEHSSLCVLIFAIFSVIGGVNLYYVDTYWYDEDPLFHTYHRERGLIRTLREDGFVYAISGLFWWSYVAAYPVFACGVIVDNLKKRQKTHSWKR